MHVYFACNLDTFVLSISTSNDDISQYLSCARHVMVKIRVCSIGEPNITSVLEWDGESSIKSHKIKSAYWFLSFSEFSKVGPLHHFPLLQLDGGSQLFCSDAIVKYLLPNEEPVELRDQVSTISFYLENFHRIHNLKFDSGWNGVQLAWRPPSFRKIQPDTKITPALKLFSTISFWSWTLNCPRVCRF